MGAKAMQKRFKMNLGICVVVVLIGIGSVLTSLSVNVKIKENNKIIIELIQENSINNLLLLDLINKHHEKE
jgi:hypothetical protein